MTATDINELFFMKTMDHEKLGFRCGLEIHQQLETRKLFCCCPSIVHDKDPDMEVRRKLRAVVGETGEIDKAAAHEQKKGRMIVYKGCSTSSCLVELDEEPPHPMNKDALAAVIQVARLLGAKVVDEIQVMRKTVVDGSNVSGFQRTALVAMDGHIDTSQGKVRIPTICIEEEAAKKVREDDESITYRLDRLGVPLIEIATETDIISPEHAKETAEKLGMVLRSTGKMKRGIGTIRQDVNVSIKGGKRVEIKGFQDLRSIPLVIENEIKRQDKAIKKGEKLSKEVRKAEPDGSTTFLRPMPGAARMYPETDVLPIRPEELDFEDVELIDDKARRYQEELGLGQDLSKVVAKSDESVVFEKLAGSLSLKPSFIAESLVSLPRELRRKENIDITSDMIEEILGLVDEGKIAKESVAEAIVAKAKGKFSLDEYKAISEDELEEDIRKIVESMQGKPFGAVMGEVMKKYRGKVDGKKASDLIRKYMG